MESINSKGKNNKFSSFRQLVHYYGFLDASSLIIFRYYSILKSKFVDISKSHTIFVNGCKMQTLANDKGISSELIMYGTHEQLTTTILLQELKKGMVCLDIGSNIGYFALLEHNLVGNSGKIICIEPSPIVFDVLKHNIKLQNTSSIEIHNFACGDENKEVEFMTNSSSNQSIIIDNNISFEGKDSTVSITKIQVKKIDSFLADSLLQKLDFIRFDTDGYEIKIYHGMRESIKKFKPTLSFELHRSILGDDKTIEFLNLLEIDGYELKYYLSGINCAKLGNLKHIKNYTIQQLIEKIKTNSIPGGFGVFLVNKN